MQKQLLQYVIKYLKLATFYITLTFIFIRYNVLLTIRMRNRTSNKVRKNLYYSIYLLTDMYFCGPQTV